LHYPLFILWARFIGSLGFYQTNKLAGNLAGFAGQIALATIAASISWRFFEEPILRLKELFPSASETHWPTTTHQSERRKLIVAGDSRA
jgi:peptidoglycan/LPS O-acetylase OafA/YrhL